MANYCPVPGANGVYFVSYPADSLYILAENQDIIVAQLIDLGKQWCADCVEVCDGTNNTEDEDSVFWSYAPLLLREALWIENSEYDRDAVLVSYWWD